MINLTVPQQAEPHMKPCISVVGVGGAGGNAVNNMIADNLQGVDFIVANTDAQALSLASTDRRIQLGQVTTQGLGAGAKPEVGRAAAEETFEEIAREIDGANMVFITAGMGGGTGTGAAPVIARVAREMGILTVGVVTKPFQFEGQHRMRLAETGIEELSQYVDTLIIIPNQNLFRVANEKTTFADAFKMADDVLNAGVRSITDLMIMPGLINLDFADVRTVMSDMGRAMMGTGEASGERRALDAAEAAIANPLLEDTCMKGAGGVLINITGGMDITLFEVDEAANRIRDEVEGEAHIIFGSCFDPELEGKMRVSVVATGISGAAAVLPRPQQGTMAHAVANRTQPQQAAAKPGQPVAQQPATAAAPTAAQAPAAPQAAPQAAPPSRPVLDDTVSTSAMPVAEEAIAHQEQPMDVRATGTDGAPAAHQPSMFEAPTQRYAEPQRPAAAPARPMEAPRQASLNVDLPPAKDNAFIPRPPVDRSTPLGEMPQRPSLFTNQQQPVKPALASSQPAEQREKPRAESRSGGFFKGLAAKLSGESEPAPRAPEPRAAEPQAHAPVHAPAQPEPQAPMQQAPVQQAQQPRAAEPHAPMQADRQDSLRATPDDRPAAPRHTEEDELEIPAFLRRQAN